MEDAEPKFASWMRDHGKLAILKDDEVDRLERAGAATMGVSRAEVLESMYNRLEPKPQGVMISILFLPLQPIAYMPMTTEALPLMIGHPKIQIIDMSDSTFTCAHGHAEPSYTAEEMKAMRLSHQQSPMQVTQYSSVSSCRVIHACCLLFMTQHQHRLAPVWVSATHHVYLLCRHS